MPRNQVGRTTPQTPQTPIAIESDRVELLENKIPNEPQPLQEEVTSSSDTQTSVE